MMKTDNSGSCRQAPVITLFPNIIHVNCSIRALHCYTQVLNTVKLPHDHFIIRNLLHFLMVKNIFTVEEKNLKIIRSSWVWAISSRPALSWPLSGWTEQNDSVSKSQEWMLIWKKSQIPTVFLGQGKAPWTNLLQLFWNVLQVSTSWWTMTYWSSLKQKWTNRFGDSWTCCDTASACGRYGGEASHDTSCYENRTRLQVCLAFWACGVHNCPFNIVQRLFWS